MSEEEIIRALNGLYAYDTGCVDSGIHDEALRRQVIDHLYGLPDIDRRRIIAHLVASYATEEAIAQGYGPEDMLSFLKWADYDMEIVIG